MKMANVCIHLKTDKFSFDQGANKTIKIMERSNQK